MGNKDDDRHLRLVGKDERDSNVLYIQLASQEFVSGSWERALARREYFIANDLIVPDEFADDPFAALKNGILLALQYNRAQVNLGQIDIARMLEWGDRLGIIGVAEEFVDGQEGADLVDRNTTKYLLEMAAYLRTLADDIVSQEGVDRYLHDIGIKVHCSDLIRIALFEMNKDRVYPSILVLPNSHHPFNPFVMLVADSPTLSARVCRLLRLFDR